MLQISLLLIFLVTTGALPGDSAQGGAGAKYSFLRVSTETLEVISDAGEPEARRALARMQQMERLLGRRKTHIRAYLFKDDRFFGDLRQCVEPNEVMKIVGSVATLDELLILLKKED